MSGRRLAETCATGSMEIDPAESMAALCGTPGGMRYLRLAGTCESAAARPPQARSPSSLRTITWRAGSTSWVQLHSNLQLPDSG
jgi:hypothetical protein